MTLYGEEPPIARDGVKIPAESNMYECALDLTWERFGAHLDGARPSVCCAVGSRPPAQAVRSALDGSLRALGYGQDACAFAAIAPRAEGEGADAATLDARALFALVEGLDPLCLIVCDRDAAGAVADAYRLPIPFERPQHVFGRPCVAFESLEALLETPAGKQRAWAALKQLPRFGERR